MKQMMLCAAGVCWASVAMAQDVTVCVSPDASIPDASALGVMIPLEVAAPAGLAVVSAEVDLVIDHAWAGDLGIVLTAPDGTAVALLDRPGVPSTGFPGPFGCGGRDLAATFSDLGLVDAESECVVGQSPTIGGVVRPSVMLAGFEGIEAVGGWTLTVTDGAVYDTGVVRSVCLRLVVGPACPPDLAEPFGTLNIFDIQAYLALYNAQDSAADLAAPVGAFNIFDLQAYINLYNQGCP